MEQPDYLIVARAVSGRRHADDTDAESGKFSQSRRPTAAGTGTWRGTTSALVRVSRCRDHALMQHHGRQVFL